MNAYRMHALKQKKNSKECYCALCRSPRVLRYQKNLSKAQFFQIFLISLVAGSASFSWLGFKVVGIPVIVWTAFEMIQKSYYRRDLVCPFCGFDPTWYKKDIKLARRKVEEFMESHPESPISIQAKKSKQKLPDKDKNLSASL